MKLARFWNRDYATVAGVRVIALGGSNDSIEAARGRARNVGQAYILTVEFAAPTEWASGSGGATRSVSL